MLAPNRNQRALLTRSWGVAAGSSRRGGTKGLPVTATPQDLVSNALWFRFGANMAYNTFMLAIWFLGPLGILLFTAGVMTDRFTRLLGLGVFTGLCLTLLHTNMGLHSVGPIHYSECAVPLTIIAVHGLATILRTAKAHHVDTRSIASAVERADRKAHV